MQETYPHKQIRLNLPENVYDDIGTHLQTD